MAAVRRRLLALLPAALLPAALLLACAPAPLPAAPGPAATDPAPIAAPRAGAIDAAQHFERPPLAFVHDDLPAAAARARAEGKALFVDAWAPWCHTCLSMKHLVLTDPSLRPLADRVVFADIDTDRPENAAFLERHAMSFWPTFFVIDPASDEVLGLWAGAASAAELREVIQEALGVMDDRAGAARPPDDPRRLLVEAKRAQAAGAHAAAAAAYRRALERGGAAWTKRSEALAGLLLALSQARDAAACAEVGTAHAAEVQGAALPADFASVLLSCAGGLPEGDPRRRAREAAIARLRAITASPPPDATPDDRADALGILSEALAAGGDAAGARAASEARLELLERAARDSSTPEAAATYDYARAMTYLALGRGGDAVAMLREREAQLPSSYEPPARLAQALHAMGRHAEAREAIDRAIARAYGPRRLRYLKLRAEIQHRLGDRAGRAATLREEVQGYEALAKGHASADHLADARRRLAEAERALAAPAPAKR